MGTITESAKAFMPKLSEIRRDFHMHPEVSQHEERTGKKVAIVGSGPSGLAAADMLAQEGISAAVLNVHTIKPYDAQTVLEWAEKCGAVVTAEEHSVIGGLGSAVAEVLAGRSGAKFARVGIEDRFGQSGTPAELFADYGLTAENIAENARRLVK